MDIGKPDPNGYYVLVFRKDLLDKMDELAEILIEEYGDIVILRLKSRALAKKLLRKYYRYIANP